MFILRARVESPSSLPLRAEVRVSTDISSGLSAAGQPSCRATGEVVTILARLSAMLAESDGAGRFRPSLASRQRHVPVTQEVEDEPFAGLASARKEGAFLRRWRDACDVLPVQNLCVVLCQTPCVTGRAGSLSNQGGYRPYGPKIAAPAGASADAAVVEAAYRTLIGLGGPPSMSCSAVETRRGTRCAPVPSPSRVARDGRGPLTATQRLIG
jgi:hypothetical protein